MLDRLSSRSELRVLDCCAGERVIWERLRKEYPVKSYLGLDIKPRRSGVVRIDSARWLRQVDWHANVIDVDTYGDPWRHWLAILEKAREPVAVFLTAGCGWGGLSEHQDELYKSAGLRPEWHDRIQRNSPALMEYLTRSILTRKPASDIITQEIVSIASVRSCATYYGVRMERS